MTDIKAVVWDLGGVLVRTGDREPRRAWERRLGLEKDSLDRLVFNSSVSRRATLGQADVQDIWDDLALRFGLTPEQAEDLRLDFWRGDQLDADLVGKIRELRTRFKTGLITNAWRDARRSIQDLWHLDQVFDAILISAELGIAKPDPAIFHRLLDQWSLAPQTAVFIDDFLENIIAARNLGMEVIHFRSPEQAIDELDGMLAG
jgi:epoxide hydrolase-like predicted phosphatase